MQLRERFALVDRAANNASNYTTAWCLQSPDGVYWIPSIDTSGIISFTSSLVPVPIIAPPLLDQDGGYWRPSISNDGLVSLTDNATVSEGELFAAFEDADSVLWLWQMDPCDQAEVTTMVIQSATLHRVSVKITFSTDSDTSLPFRVYSVRPYLKVQHQDVPYRYEAAVECRVTRPSLRITWTGGPFVMDTMQLRLKALKNQVKG